MYNITQYSFKKAKELNVQIKPSTRKYKKIDVFRNKIFLCSIGDIRYKDYPTYLLTHDIKYAKIRRTLYKIRHEFDRYKLDSPGYFADRILW